MGVVVITRHPDTGVYLTRSSGDKAGEVEILEHECYGFAVLEACIYTEDGGVVFDWTGDRPRRLNVGSVVAYDVESSDSEMIPIWNGPKYFDELPA